MQCCLIPDVDMLRWIAYVNHSIHRYDRYWGKTMQCRICYQEHDLVGHNRIGRRRNYGGLFRFGTGILGEHDSQIPGGGIRRGNLADQKDATRYWQSSKQRGRHPEEEKADPKVLSKRRTSSVGIKETGRSTSAGSSNKGPYKSDIMLEFHESGWASHRGTWGTFMKIKEWHRRRACIAT